MVVVVKKQLAERFTFVPSWDDPLINNSVHRVFAKQLPALEEVKRFWTARRLNYMAREKCLLSPQPRIRRSQPRVMLIGFLQQDISLKDWIKTEGRPIPSSFTMADKPFDVRGKDFYTRSKDLIDVEYHTNIVLVGLTKRHTNIVLVGITFRHFSLNKSNNNKHNWC